MANFIVVLIIACIMYLAIKPMIKHQKDKENGKIGCIGCSCSSSSDCNRCK